MKSFDLETSDLQFTQNQIADPIVRIVRYDTTGTPIYGFERPDNGVVVELGQLGTFDLLAVSSQWQQFAPSSSLDNINSPNGLRNVSGLFNNLASPAKYGWGAANRPFLRSSDADYTRYLQQIANGAAFYNQQKTSTVAGLDQTAVNGLAGQSWKNLTLAEQKLVQNSNWQQIVAANGNVDNSQRYQNPFLTVYDGTPRSISQVITSANGDDSAFARLEAAAPGTITDTTTFTKKAANGDDATFTEKFQRNVNTESDGTSLSGWNVLFGQFFDHGLDSIGKGGNKLGANAPGSKIVIPLAPDDPLYAVTPPNADGVRALSIARATIANPEQAGADGKFGTADDILNAGADGKFGTADDVLGKANPEYDNHVSPYIDQSQTYGSSDDVTNLLREWIIDPTTGKYAPGMKLFDGTSLANAWERTNPDGSVELTKETLPTLNELRAYLRQTGRDDLSWSDIENFRVRDAQGKVLDLDKNPSNGIQAKLTNNTLVADFLPRLDLAHINAAGLTDFKTLFPSFSGNIADYLNVNSGQPTALGQTTPDIVNELLLRSIGDHYIAGDGRVNENFGLTAIHHVWHEDHNWQINNLIQAIDQQQANDSTKTAAHAWQTAVTATGAGATGIQIVNGHYEDTKGNYTDKAGNTNWNQEKMFQAAVSIVQMEYQHVAIDQYARGMSPNIPEFEAYDPKVNADVSLEYSQSAFRFGHSQLRETIDTLDPNGSLSGLVTKFALEQAFLTPSQYAASGPTAIAQGMTRQFSSEIDEIITPTLQQALLGQPQDLAAINIARGRDLGIPTLNTLRRQLYSSFDPIIADLKQQLAANPKDAKLQEKIDRNTKQQLGLKAYTSWSDFGKNLLHPTALVNFIAAYSFNSDLNKANMVVKLGGSATLATLTADETAAYQSLGWTEANAKSNALNFLNTDQGFEKIDTWVGGLAEKHVDKGELGATFDAVFADQMSRLINGDRFYYFWRLQLGLPEFTQLISSVTVEQFKDVIERTTGAKHLTGDVFFATDSHLELGEDPTLAQNNNATADAAGHRYGNKVAELGIGVHSVVGTDTSKNGTAIDLQSTDFGGINAKYISDVRTDSKAHETIGGTEFADYIDAGIGDDTVYGDKGNDILIGNDGGDHLYGEQGNDYISGGAGDDFLDGGDGNDQISGDDGDDVLIGGNGDDRLMGGAGKDELQGNNGNDYIDGGTDDDTVYGGYGNDTIYGGAGDDRLYGEWGNDKIYGGAGADTISGGAGKDFLSGGEGDDTYLFNAGFGQDTIEDAGSSTLDLVKFGAGLTLDKFEVIKQGDDLVLKLKGTSDTLTIKGQFGSASANAIEKFQFDNGAKTLTNDELQRYANSGSTDPEGLMLDFSQIVAPTIKVNCTLSREAVYNDAVGFYKAIDATGAIQTSKGIVRPGDIGYAQAAVQNALSNVFGSSLDLGLSNGSTKTLDATFDKSIYMPIVVAQGTLAGAASGQNVDRIYTSFLGSNSDKASHIRLIGDNTFGFEDLVGGGDRDFNDIIFTAKVS